MADTNAIEPMAPAAIHALLARVGEVAPDYSNLTTAEAVALIMAVNNVDEVEARFQLGLANGTITGDVIKVTKDK